MKPALAQVSVLLLGVLAAPAAVAQSPGGPRIEARSSTSSASSEYDEDVETQDVIEEEEQPPAEEPPKYRNPQGAFNVSGYLGASTGDGGTRFVIGVGVGYAVLTGVMPGVRGLLATGSGGLGGELAASLTLTPPLTTSFTPFVVGEVGRRFEPQPLGGGWMYGAGGGLFLGDPESRVAVQLGWMFRKISFDAGSVDFSGPIVAISVRL